jgi:hypothetical protein
VLEAGAALYVHRHHLVIGGGVEKGSGSGYELDRISEIGAAIEQAARQRDEGKIRELAQALEDFSGGWQ